jgi:SpoVK/Ycf46/Vps4 family AAA+-type ATPase
MTSLAQVTALVDSHINRDHARFRAITLQIAANLAARSPDSAERLRKLVDKQQGIALTPLPSAQGMLSMPEALSSIDDMVLSQATRDRLDRIVLEHTRRFDLLARGLLPARKFLFAGSSGTGKTMAAGALARAVGLPMFRVELHAVIASHLGETSANLAKVFEHVRTLPGVYLFDEFDALGADRSSVSDGSSAGAEMRRVVNSILQFIDDDRSDSLIVAATNFASMIDGAIFRRFDESIAFETMTIPELAELSRRKLEGFDASPLDFGAIHAANTRLGHADLCAALDCVRKDHVLAGAPIDTPRIVEAIERRSRSTCQEPS